MLGILSGRRVLVVEDEMMVLMNIEGALSDLGCETILVAATADIALKAIADTQHLDVAMLDINLGNETSYRVADALAERAVPFLFSTGYGEVGVAARFSERPVLNKPYSDEELGEALANLLPAA